MPPGKAIRALNHAYRQRILGVLEEGPITYSDLLSSLEPKGSERGRFNYHLRALREAGLVGVEESLYALSASGKAALRFLKELSENPHLPNRRRKPLTVVWSLLAVSVILSTAFLWVLYTGIPASDPNPEVRPGWGSPMLMAEGEEGDRQVLSWRIATESSGNGLVVWVQKEGNQSNLYASRFVPWTGWSSPAFIVTTSPTVENAYLGSLRISSDPQGNAIVLWTEKGARLFSSRYAPGLGWGPPELVYEGVGKTRISSVDLAMGPSGAAVAVWKSCRRDNGDWWGISFDCSVLSNRLEAENGWSSLAKINSDGVGRGVTEPVVGIDREGNAVAVWGQRGGEDQGGGLEEEKHWRLWANRYVFGTGWEGPAPLSGESNYVFGLDLSVSLSGHALAVWSQVDSDGASLNANRFSPVYGWGLPQEISPTPGSRPEAVIGFQGEALVAWEEWDVDGYDGDRLPMRLMARRLVPGVGWDPATVVWRFDSVSSYNPPCHAFGSDRAGNALIVWTDQGNRDTLDPPRRLCEPVRSWHGMEQ